jgi:DNA-binding NarL/FixJ family response regulator
MTRLRILIADSHDVVRRSLRAALEDQPSWFVVGEATTGPETLAHTVDLKPDVVIVDIAMNGIRMTREIARLTPHVAVIVLTLRSSNQLAQRLHDAGARGYVTKTNIGSALVDLIHAVVERRPTKGHPFPGDGRHDDSSAQSPVDGALTAREREVLQLLAEGNTNREVAGTLEISAKTVETHRARIMSKLQLRSVGQLVRFAIRHRIIAP